jgi:hypothetical protein
LFDVRVNNATVATNVDPFALAGTKFRAVVRDITVAAGAGAVTNVSFVSTKNNAGVAALEVSTLVAQLPAVNLYVGLNCPTALKGMQSCTLGMP